MSTEFNYVARLDTSQLMSGLSEIRSQVGMALGGAGGFGGGPMSATDFAGGAGAGMSQMMASMGGGGLGGTWSDPSIANIPHYGMRGAMSTLEQEGLLARPGGMAEIAKITPPGVAPGEFAFAIARNSVERSVQAEQAARFAGEAAISTTAASVVGGLGGGFLGSLAGARFGPAGKFVGGLIGSVLGEEIASAPVQRRYSEAEKIRGVTEELGDIVSAGRNLGRERQYELGMATRNAAKDINMDVNQMGDIMALARESGLLPSTTDPNKLRQQAGELANAFREVSQTVHSSLADASQIIKNAAQKGLTLNQAMAEATGIGGGGGMGSMLYSMGAATGRGMMFTGAQGGQLFSGAMGQAMGAGLSGEEMRILGGPMGVASMIGATQMQMASSPLGTLQLMAARGGQALGSLTDLPGQALSAMTQGGDLLSNMGKFLVHQDEYKRGIGAGGIRTMARQQIDAMADMMEGIMPEMSRNELRRMSAIQMGMDATRAEAYVGGLFASPGGGGGGNARFVKAQQLASLAASSQEGQVAAMVERIPAAEPDAEFGFKNTGMAFLAGATIHPLVGAGAAAVTFVADNYKAMKQTLGGLFDSAGDAATSASQTPEEMADRMGMRSGNASDRQMNQIYADTGYVKFDQDMAARVLTADLSTTRLEFKGSAQAAGVTQGALALSGISPVSGGPGTIQIGGASYATSDVQRVIMGTLRKKATPKQHQQAAMAAYSAVYDPDAKKRLGQDPQTLISELNSQLAIVAGKAAYDPSSKDYADASAKASQILSTLVGNIDDPKMRAMVQEDMKRGGAFADQSITQTFLKGSKVEIENLRGAELQMTRVFAAAGTGEVADEAKMESEQLFQLGRSRASLTNATLAHAESITAYAFQASPEYQAVRRRAQRGQVSGKQLTEEVELARKTFIGKGGIPKGGAHLGEIDAEQAIKVVPNLSDLVGAINASLGGDPKALQVLEDMNKLMAQGQTLEGGIKGETRKGGTSGLREGGGGPPTQIRKIGFGEQEQALTTINRALEKTEKALARTATMIKQMQTQSGGGVVTPAAGNATSTGTGP